MIEKLKEKKLIAEGNLIGCLWKMPDLYAEIEVDKNQLGEDGLFYYAIGEQLYKLKHNKFDEVAVYSLLEGNDSLKKGWEDRGGYNEIKKLIDIIDLENADGYYDSFNKYSLLEKLNDKGFNVEKEWSKFERMTASQVFDYFDYQLNSLATEIGTDIEYETLEIDDKFIKELESGMNVGINYGKHSPIMNYLTLGLPKKDLTMIASYTNGGKTSFITSNILIPIAEEKKHTCIISNEQQSSVYKILLLVYVLTQRLDYWKLTRKKIKIGKFSSKDMEMIQKAKEIVKTDYAPYITFVKTFDYQIGKVKKIIRKLAKRGLEVVIYDTMKGENLSDGNVWQNLIEDSKQLFQIVSKENVAGVVSFQLALHSKNKRFLDETCLSHSKQILEVFSEAIFFKDLWEDEYAGQKYDVKPYTFKRDPNGKFTNIKEMIELDPSKKYKAFTLVKTRNDQKDISVLYEFKGHYNIWKEKGYCTVHHDRGY